jgi:hypothetical protein
MGAAPVLEDAGVNDTEEHSMRTPTIIVAALAAAALVAPAGATAGYVTAGRFQQFVAPYPVAKHDQAFTVVPNATQTFRMAIPELDGSAHHFQVPCWGYDLVGPGLDLAAAGLEGFGWIGDAATEWRGDRPDAAIRDAAGNWTLPESHAVIGETQVLQGRSCRAIGWNWYVDPKIDGPNSAVARAARKARRTHRPIPVKPKHKVKATRANLVDDGTATVTLAGMRYVTAGRVKDGVEMVVTVTAGPLAGPTTLTAHARVLLQP